MFYVYELIDPRDGRPFYVGKGKGNRVHHHERDAKAGAELGRFARIKEIWAAGLSVEKRIVERFADEAAAYAAESKRIAEIGLENLTNRTPGAGMDPTASVDREWARTLWTIAYKTEGFKKVRRWWFCQQWHQLPACALIAFGNQWDALVAKRGQEWVREHCSAMRSNAV